MTAQRGPLLAQIGPDNLRSQARRVIRACITTGEIEAGAIYPIAFFASQLGVSATPVREALFDLAHEGLIEVVRNRGFRVMLATDHDLDEIFQLRTMLEVPAAGLVTGKIDADGISRCRAHALEIEEQAKKGDLVGFLDADRSFHMCLLEPLGNKRLVETVSRLRVQARLYGLPKLAETGELITTAREHLRILAAVEMGDAVEAETLMRMHLTHSRGIWVGRAEQLAYSTREAPEPKRHGAINGGG